MDRIWLVKMGCPKISSLILDDQRVDHQFFLQNSNFKVYTVPISGKSALLPPWISWIPSWYVPGNSLRAHRLKRKTTSRGSTTTLHRFFMICAMSSQETMLMLSWLFSNLDQPAHRPCGHSWMAPGQMIPVTEIIQICDSWRPPWWSWSSGNSQELLIVSGPGTGNSSCRVNWFTKKTKRLVWNVNHLLIVSCSFGVAEIQFGGELTAT